MTTTPALVGLVSAAALTAVSVVVVPAAWQPWVQIMVVVIAATVGVLARRDLPLLPRGPRARTERVELMDLLTAGRVAVGCVDGERVVTTAVEITTGAVLCTEVAGDDPTRHHGVRVPLGVIAGQLDQGGVALEGIDVVTRGRRTSSGPDGEVYASLLGPLELTSHRSVHLLVRFDLDRLAVSVGAHEATPLEQVVATATLRIRHSLVHHGLTCRVLDATELADLYLEAERGPGNGVGLVLLPGSDPRTVIDGLGSARAATVTEVHRLRRVEGRTDVVDMVTSVGLVGLPDTSSADLVRTATDRRCRTLPSPQVLPVPGEPLPSAVAGSLTRRETAELDLLAPPAHGCGQILGASREATATAVQLAGPHLRSVLLAARPAVCRQVAFRAVAAGYRLAVVTDVPDRWRPLLAIGDEARYRIIAPDASDAGAPVDAVVWDVDAALSEGRIDAFAGPGGPDVTQPTVIRVDADWGVRGAQPAHTTAPPDLVLDGRIDGWISVEPRDGPAHRVSVVAGPGEEPFVGPLTPPGTLTPAGAAPSATPGRQ